MKAQTKDQRGNASADRPSIRIDKLLWFLRFARNRTMAQKLATRGHVRLNGRRIDRSHVQVRQSDILTVPQGRQVHVIRIRQLPLRRGSAADVAHCFERLRTGE